MKWRYCAYTHAHNENDSYFLQKPSQTLHVFLTKSNSSSIWYSFYNFDIIIGYITTSRIEQTFYQYYHYHSLELSREMTIFRCTFCGVMFLEYQFPSKTTKHQVSQNIHSTNQYFIYFNKNAPCSFSIYSSLIFCYSMCIDDGFVFLNCML